MPSLIGLGIAVIAIWGGLFAMIRQRYKQQEREYENIKDARTRMDADKLRRASACSGVSQNADPLQRPPRNL